MSALPSFSGDNPLCPKCQNYGASTQYRERGTCVHGPAWPGEAFGRQKNERLHRECRRCDYAWDEALAVQLPDNENPEPGKQATR